MARHIEIILLSFVAQFCIGLTSNISYNETSDNIIDNCIIDILTSKTQFNSIVTVINSDAISNRLLQRIHSSNNVNVYIKGNVSMEVTPTVYLLHTQNETEFEDIIYSLHRDWNRHPEALYIVILKNMFEDYLAEVFRLLWEYHFIHVLVIIKDLYSDASIYTYFPYADGQCGRDNSTIVMLCDCKSAEIVDVVAKLHEHDKPVLDNCTLNVATGHYPPLVFCNPEPKNNLISGVERFLIELLVEKKNISLNYTCFLSTEDIGTVSDNYTVSGIFNKLYENEVALLFGGISLNNRRRVFFDSVYIYFANEDVYVTVIHKSALHERWKIVYLMFDANVWVLLFFTMVFCAIMLSDFRKIFIIQTTHVTITEFLNIFGNATQNMILFLRERLHRNFVITHWIWFIFFITCFYHTRLTSLTIYRSYKPQLDQYFSLYNYKLTPCIPFDVASFIKNSGNVPIINEENIDKSGNCETAEMALDEIAKTEDKYTVTMYFQYLWWLRNNVKDKERVHLMKECIFNNLYGLFFKRGFPFLESFNAIMGRLPEHGFVRASKDFHHLSHQLASDSASTVVKLVKTPLMLEDLTIPFGLLATGMVLSLMVLIAEITYKQRSNDIIIL